MNTSPCVRYAETIHEMLVSSGATPHTHDTHDRQERGKEPESEAGKNETGGKTKEMRTRGKGTNKHTHTHIHTHKIHE